MSVLIGGGVAVLFGLIGLIIWWRDFFVLLKGGIPILLLLGGALAVYVGIDELREKVRESQEKEKTELEKAKAEAEKYREELEKMKGPQE